jgi:hypothetical protein
VIGDERQNEKSVSTDATRMKNRRSRRRLLIVAILVFGLLAGLWLMLTQPLWFVTAGKIFLPTEVSPEKLRTDVELLSNHLSPRDYRRPENLDRVAAWVREKFAACQGRVRMQTYDVSGRNYCNVIALFGPETKERIVIGAHYDTCLPYPGADDNASGVAGLVALAELFSRTELPMQIELVAYTLEEPPFFRSEYMGSAIHARSLKAQGAQVRAMFALEMIGYFSDASGSQSFPNPALRLFYPSQGNFIAVVGNFAQAGLVRRTKRAMRAAGLIPVYSINAPGWLPGVDFSDHLNYWEQGYPAVMITDTSFYRNKNYHTASDTPDQLDYQRMAMVVKSVYAAVLKFAQTD